MLEFGDNARLLLEACRELTALGQLARQDLDRYITIDGRLVGFVDSGHSASADLIDNAIGTEHLPGLNGIHAALLFDVSILRWFCSIFKLQYANKLLTLSCYTSLALTKSIVSGNCFDHSGCSPRNE